MNKSKKDVIREIDQKIEELELEERLYRTNVAIAQRYIVHSCHN
ncbi:MAG TPA: hypothetical protein VE619_08200 [Nitrososphaeraceae archaeon]|nr:hypothetical protein [Nitrososphaeraceae archaeon]